jgi:hypothetical protein
LYDRYHDPDRVAWMLNIKKPPTSLQVIGCKSGAITDVVITCVAKISPEEFPLLLSGYKYGNEPTSGSSHDVFYEKIGNPFVVATKYEARPASFKNGGAVTVVTDEARKNVVIDLYIE